MIGNARGQDSGIDFKPINVNLMVADGGDMKKGLFWLFVQFEIFSETGIEGTIRPITLRGEILAGPDPFGDPFRLVQKTGRLASHRARLRFQSLIVTNPDIPIIGLIGNEGVPTVTGVTVPRVHPAGIPEDLLIPLQKSDIRRSDKDSIGRLFPVENIRAARRNPPRENGTLLVDPDRVREIFGLKVIRTNRGGFHLRWRLVRDQRVKDGRYNE